MMLIRAVRFLFVACWAAGLVGLFLPTAAQFGGSTEPSFRVTAESGTPEIPFEVDGQHVVFPMTVNGQGPFRLVLDTGMPMGGILLYKKQTVDQLELDYADMPIHVGGAGGEGHRTSGKLALDETVGTSGLTVEHASVLVLDVPAGFTRSHDGIVGAMLFNRFAVEIDVDEELLRLHQPKGYQPPTGATSLPIELIGNMPFVSVGVTFGNGQSVDARVVVDLGAGHDISLNTEGSETIAVPDRALATSLGHGLSGKINGHVGRIERLKLGGLNLDDVIAAFPEPAHQNPRGMDSLDGNLGNGILARFNTTFDYAGKRMVLQPNGRFETPFEFGMSGLRFAFGSGPLQVEQVLPDSPAARVGLRPGDVVTHIDGQAVEAGDRSWVEELCEVGKSLRLSVRRGDEAFEKTIQLRRLI